MSGPVEQWMTEENRNEQESADGPQASEEESAKNETVETDEPTRASFAFGKDAEINYPGQVRAALEYAKENQYEYGPRLRDVELSWDVVSVEPMSNDIARVRLEYSPTTSFRGDPGSEYMDIDSGGAILARRQIQVPKENKPVVLMGITAFSVVLAVALVSLMTVFKSEGGDPLYVAGRTLWIRAEIPKSQPFIIYRGSDNTGALQTWGISANDSENNEMVYVQVTLINQTSGTVSLVIDEDAAVLLDGDRASYSPMNTLERAVLAEYNARFNVSGFVPLWGSIALNGGEQVIGMLAFEMPKESSFTEIRWNASDSATIRYQ